MVYAKSLLAFLFVFIAAIAVSSKPAVADPNPCTVTPNGSGGWNISCAANPPTVLPAIFQTYNGNSPSGASTYGGVGSADDGDNGGNGGSPTLDFPGMTGPFAIETFLTNPGPGVLVQSIGGDGGGGGNCDACTGSAGDGGTGGSGGNPTVTIEPNLPIFTQADSSPGVWVVSAGGRGGNGGDCNACAGSAGSGGSGGAGGDITLNVYDDIVTVGNQSVGIVAQSLGGGGGNSGGGILNTGSGNGGASQNGGSVTVNLGLLNTINDEPGSVTTYGNNAIGILAQSVGGHGGAGGSNGNVLFGSGGNGGNAGSGGLVTVNTTSDSFITTYGQASTGIEAESVGGNGGEGGDSNSAFYSTGGSGSAGGNGGTVNVNNAATIATYGAASKGIFAQSIGGGGGDGGSGGGIVGLGGNGSSTSPGGNVTIDNSGNITTYSTLSLTTGQNPLFGTSAIFAQSIGGGGGNGGSGSGLFSVGGGGGGGGDGGTISVGNSGTLTTNASDSSAIFAQSVGGGGGNGGGSVAVSADVSVGIGGAGGNGGVGHGVTVNSSGIIDTYGARSNGIEAQSLGGGGGNGGFAVSVAAGVVPSPINLSLGIGGSGGNGGAAGTVNVTSGSTIVTAGDNANGIFAQSIGGGGGNGGYAISASLAPAAPLSLSIGLGGSGGKGGDANGITLSNTGGITTTGNNASGIVAQSIGGGGGNGGFSVSASGGAVAASFGLGGSGGSGGNVLGDVSVDNSGVISTGNAFSDGILAQSIGGGGGNGGFSVTGDLGAASAGLSIGGGGTTGGTSGNVTLTNSGGVTTTGFNSSALAAESLGGGGGNGGFSVSGNASWKGGLGFSVGGSGAGGSDVLGTVTLTNSGVLQTLGDLSNGMLAQSIGGGGGNGGFSVAGSVSGGPTGSGSIGGSGGNGGNGNSVYATNNDTITTFGFDSNGVLAQSIGGGGGNGGFSVAGNISAQTGAAAFSLGGAAGGGGNGALVSVNSGTNTNAGSITTYGTNANGIAAESLGGGGGNGGFSVAGDIAAGSSLNIGIGGSGGSGGSGGEVDVTNYSTIATGAGNTPADFANGILAESVGGGGGNGGFSIGGSLTQNMSANVGVGGAGGTAGNGGSVTLDNYGLVSTNGYKSEGVLAQSIGGTGGNGGFSVAGGITANSSQINLSLGGGAGNGGSGGSASVFNYANVQTLGGDSTAVEAQSVGGGGGNGGFSITAAGKGSQGFSGSFSMGGSGGNGGSGALASVTNGAAQLLTIGDEADGILAQSIGGGGGHGGWSVAGTIATGKKNLTLSFGGSGGSGSKGGTVQVTSGSANTSTLISTSGANANGIIAESIGGGGGDGGWNVEAMASAGSSLGFGMGGNGGTGDDAKSVSVTNYSTIQTTGNNSNGIDAQAIGGGGGSGGFNDNTNLAVSTDQKFGIGLKSMNNFGNGGGGGNGGEDPSIGTAVTVNNYATITTGGENSNGILAESIGGGGGYGGFSYASQLAGDAGIGLGSSADGGGNGESVSVTNAGSIGTLGDNSAAIEAQSIGMGGGAGGFALSGGLNTELGAKFGSLLWALGANGGHGGNGGDVTVNSTATTLSTHGANSAGILAQSLGAGGGSGGTATVGDASLSKFLAGFTLGVGGQAGSTGNGGNVTVNNSSGIITQGDNSDAILGQSIGGGGGNGGNSTSVLALLGLNASLAIGGNGAAGGSGGTVNITSTGSSISTSGFESSGIVAESIGGGGGNGGSKVSGLPIPIDSLLGFTLGGNGGGSGDGGTASITNSTSVSTTGLFAEDLVSQSLGGGGGVAGTGFLDAANTSITGPLLLGATGGTPGNGGAASASNSAQITTTGLGSAAMVAQSLGGGGGLAQLDITGSVTESTGGLTFGASGISGSPGNSGTASGTDSGFVATSGDASDAMLAQSISAGGGLGIFDIGTFASLSLQINEGASTADLGTAGNANITTSSSAVLQTLGFNSNAIAAQSIAGGGGSGTTIAGGVGSSTTISYAVGGTGTSGTPNANGTGGSVTVTNHAKQIVTNGDLSNVILAQSIGGGGGDAAFKIGGTLSNDAISGVLGGSQLSAGSGGTVSVTNTGLIGANGNGSLGILAQSIGGGGGFGGFETLSGTLSNAAFTLGGTSDSGTSGGTAQIANSGKIVNTGNGDAGMLAQSIGGGGGLTGAVNLNLGTAATTLNLLAGENGGSNNTGGAANATNTAQIITSAVDAFGVAAESIGGGGGNDPLLARGALTSGSSGHQFSMQLGGAGNGSGNNAGIVSVTNNVPLSLGAGESVSTEDLDWDEAPLTTSGDGSIGVLGQSIGAGGGNGYLSFNGAFSTGMPKNAQVLLGSGAGQSGNGGSVTVNASGGVLTGMHSINGHWSGAFADGILGQSIGGGGGNAVLSLELGLPGMTASAGNLSVNVGGHGTGDGGNVTLNDVNGSVLTFGSDAPAVIAQSIGGGGGNGAVNVFGPAKLSPPSKNPAKYTLNINVGGNGATGNGGTVNVTQSGGMVQTVGDSSQGILAQSIGGGGGSAGPIHTVNEFPATWCSSYANNCSVHMIGANVAIGGNGSSGNGGAVTVSNNGTITTAGEDSSAILAQSIGGGGGIGGDADIVGGPSLTITAGGKSTIVGGTNGANGSGNAVSVTDAGAIATAGDNSSGIFAQSIGGGGGVGGLGMGSVWGSGTTLLGGSGGSSGNGNTVSVTVNNTGTTNMISTSGKAAFGIFAQSVGGGGGLAGDVTGGVSASALGKPSKLTALGGGGGSGNAVTVVDNGNIKTTGSGADGIFAQSVGGGGGLTTGFAGSAGAVGNGGEVDVTQNGIIETTGNYSNAIFAQSAGGTGTGGNVNVTVTGMALAYGSNSDGILAQSTGGAGSGSINVLINPNSVVQGGTGSGSAGVVMIGGTNNTLVNHGTITTAGSVNAVPKPLSLYEMGTAIEGAQSAAGGLYQTTSLMTDKTSLLSTFTGSTEYSSGTAVYASGGTLNLNNQGNIYGSLAMNGTSLNFTNSGTFVSGTQLNLGTGTMSLASGSVMTPGAGGFVASTDLFGNFVEESGSDYLVTLDLNNNLASLLNVSGTASLGGSIDLDLLGTNAAAPGRHSDTIVNAGGGLTNNGLALTPPQSAVATFDLGYLPDALQLNYDVNYAPTVGRMLSTNDLAFGNYIGAIQTAGSTPALASFMSSVFGIPTVPKLKTFYDRFTPGASVALGSSALFSNLQFSDQILRCHSDGIVTAQGNCSWAQLGSSFSHADSSLGSVGYGRSDNGFAYGFEHRNGNGFAIGAAIHYTKSALFDNDSGSSLNGNGLEAGISASRMRHDGVLLSADLLGGEGNYNSVRQIGYPSVVTTANGTQGMSYFGTHLRAEKRYGSELKAVTPFVDFGVTRVNAGELFESGAGTMDEHVEPYRATYPTISSGLRLEDSKMYRGSMLHGSLDLSVTQIVGNPQAMTTATLAGAPAGVAPFAVTNTLDRTQFGIGPSLDITRNNKTDIRIGAAYSFSRHTHSGGAYLEFRLTP